MCGRFGLYRPTDALAELFDAHEAPDLRRRWAPSYNIAPTRDVIGLAVTRGGRRVLDLYRWGLVPSWARDPSVGSRLFNARAEGLAASRAFADAFGARRLAIVADGFFEWRPREGRRPQPLFFRRADGAPLAIAGLWESWWARARGGPDGSLVSCAMVTTAAGPDLAGVHDRMPVILDPLALEAWLDPRTRDPRSLEELLRPPPAGTLVHHAVDPRVGDTGNDDPELVAPYEPEGGDPEPLRLFG
jgi:putative SOS response-associated peptidase YedK